MLVSDEAFERVDGILLTTDFVVVVIVTRGIEQKSGENRIRRARVHNRMKGKAKKANKRKADPLKTFSSRN